MKINFTLAQKISWDLLGSVIYSLSQWLILIILAKTTNPSIVGLYALGLALTAPILLLTNLQLRSIQATDSEGKFEFRTYYLLRQYTNSVSIFIILIILFIFKYDFRESAIILLIGISKIIDSLSDVIYGKFQKNGRLDLVGISKIFKGVSSIIGVSISMYTTNSLLISLIILNILWLFIFLFYDKKMLKMFTTVVDSENNNLKQLKSLFVLSFPLGIVLMLGSLNVSLPRIFIENYWSSEVLGYFASISYLILTGSIVINSIGQATAPTLADLYYKNEIEKYVSLLKKMLLIGLLFGLIGLFLVFLTGEWILTFLYDSTYAKYNNVLILCMLAGTFEFLASFLGYALTAMGVFIVQAYSSLLLIAINFTSCIILIPHYGITGAGFVLLITSFSQFSFFMLILTFKLKNHSIK